MDKPVVLILDDQVGVLKGLGDRLAASYSVHTAPSIEVAEKIVKSEQLDFAVIDLKLDWRSEYGGIQFINHIKRNQPRVKVLVLSGYDPSPSIRSQLEVEVEGWISKIDPGHNYISSVLDKLTSLQSKPPRKRCLVIMPISGNQAASAPQWDDIFENTIRPAVEAAGYECVRAVIKAGNILEGILDKLNRADLVVADLSGQNPNVFYELGVRHALRDHTILIAQDLADVPFDLRGQATQIYDWMTQVGKEAFKKDFLETIEELMEKEPQRAVSPVRRYLEPIDSPSRN